MPPRAVASKVELAEVQLQVWVQIRLKILVKNEDDECKGDDGVIHGYQDDEHKDEKLPGHQEQDVQLTNLGEVAPTQPCALQCTMCITMYNVHHNV